ncbi:MAG: hypothetical protein VX278_02315 [Myxococcota bacterium]|nr:hypothetical protein [Myxococcota bacterium]
MLIFLNVLGCSDYNLQLKNEPEAVEPVVEEPPPILDPLMVVDPTRIEVEGMCEDTVRTQNISILNAGEGVLEISDISLAASGWSLSPLNLPMQIQPSSMETITLEAGAGSGVLTILSNDPVEPSLWVELHGTVDQAPSLRIDSPQDGAIIPIGGTELQASVQEIEDDLTSLLVEWHSNVDGLIDTTPVSADGSTALSFEGTNYGNHEISALVYDSCGNEGYDAIAVCQQYGYDAESLDISTWHFEGTANWDSNIGVVELTEPTTASAGTAFSTATEVSAENVEIEFQFFVSGGTGADGFSLTALDTARMTGFVGQTGGGIGYGGLPGWSIEVDTYYNGSDPTSADHVALSFDGDVTSPAVWAALPEMEDGQWHTMRVLVAAPYVKVDIDGVTYIDQDIPGHYAFMSYIGFTAGTGSLTNFHLIDALTVTELVCEESE